MRHIPRLAIVVGVVILGSPLLTAQNTLNAGMQGKVDRAVRDVMAKTSVPSVSLGIVQGGQIVYTAAYGQAKLEPPARAATTSMHYAIGSISKQFTVACLMLLAEEGKLTLDDPVGKYFPELTRSNEVMIRNILSHTSGYEDYAPQDYTIPEWTKPTTAQQVVRAWATKPLDFDPGTQYQYSNTNFNIAGLIVEQVSGQPFWTFLSARVLTPLHMTKTIDLDTQHDLLEPTGYFRNALGPLRPALMEAPGWYFADGEMAMPVGDLLTWDISILTQSLLKPASYVAMETEMKLKNGRGAAYALGLSVAMRDGHRVVAHGGEVGGFVASNTVYLDDRVAVAVLTNQEASSAAGLIGRAVGSLIVPPALPATPASSDAAKAETQAKQVLTALQHGTIDRAVFTANCNFYFSQQAIDDYAKSLMPLGALVSVKQTSTSLRGGMTFRAFDVTFASGTKAQLTTYTMPDGKLEQFLVAPAG